MFFLFLLLWFFYFLDLYVLHYLFYSSFFSSWLLVLFPCLETSTTVLAIGPEEMVINVLHFFMQSMMQRTQELSPNVSIIFTSHAFLNGWKEVTLALYVIRFALQIWLLGLSIYMNNYAGIIYIFIYLFIIDVCLNRSVHFF